MHKKWKGHHCKIWGDNLALSTAQDAFYLELNTCSMSSSLTAFSRCYVTSMINILHVDVQTVMPVSFLFSSRMTFPTALAALVDAEKFLWVAPW